MTKIAAFIFGLLIVPILFLELSGQKTMSSLDMADNMAQQAAMQKSIINVNGFNMLTYSRLKNNGPANIYVEGDSADWYSDNKDLKFVQFNPMALKLAAADDSSNVIYIARPCQYINSGKCSEGYHDQKRYAPEIIAAVSGALDDMKAEYNLANYNLIGYSSGAAIATIMAAERQDVASLRSVAGVLDKDKFTDIHNQLAMTGSLNPADYSAKLSHLPQYHFIGANDKTAPAVIYQSYAQNMQDDSCANYEVVKDMDHFGDWDKAWPKMLKKPVECHLAQRVALQ